MESKMTSCSLCSNFENEPIAVLGLYYDSLPLTSVSLLDSAVVTIMCLLKEEELHIDNPRFVQFVDSLNPDVMRNHYFLNFCNTKEKSINDWDVTEILKTLMFSLKNGTVCIRQFANLTKLLKHECVGQCNTFKTNDILGVLEKRLGSNTEFYISDKNTLQMSNYDKGDNTAERFKIACNQLKIEML